jgi:hypothetical protein
VDISVTVTVTEEPPPPGGEQENRKKTTSFTALSMKIQWKKINKIGKLHIRISFMGHYVQFNDSMEVKNVS